MKLLRAFSFILLIWGLNNSLLAQCFTTQTFSTTGEYSFVLPGTCIDTFIFSIECVGADGGPFALNGIISEGGSGANMQAEYEFHGGDSLIVFVGESGKQGGNPAGGGGGGGSAVVAVSLGHPKVIIAAGAGGGSGGGGTAGFGTGGFASLNSPPQGGDAPGASGGGGFNSPGMNGVNSTGGGAGTLMAIGAGGSPGVVAGFGGQGFGGGGGGAGTVGGGGGGHHGGDGGSGIGGAPLAGQGGDSYINQDYVTNVISATPGITGDGTRSNGIVVISCLSFTGGSPMLEISLDQLTHPTCANGNNGSIIVSGINGLLPYMFSIDGVAFSPSGIFDNLASGNYIATVRDALGDEVTTTITLNEPSAIILTLDSVTDNSCYGFSEGQIIVSASGGSSPYSFAIDSGTPQNSGIFSDLAADSYFISVSDNAGCSTQLTATVGESDEIVLFPAPVPLLCFEDGTGQVVVDVSGGTAGYLYSIDGVHFQMSNSFTALAALTYTIWVEDSAGCLVSSLVEVTQPDTLTLTLTSTNTSCGEPGGTISASAAGGTAPYIYSINMTTNSHGEFIDLTAGTYTVNIIDANGCMASASVTITMSGFNPIVIDTLIGQEPSCAGQSDGSITISASGGNPPLTYIANGVSSADGSFVGLMSDTFLISVTDDVGCTISTQYILTQSDPLDATVSILGLGCSGAQGGSLLVTVTGGNPPYMFTLNDSIVNVTGEFTNLAPSDYDITVSDSRGCTTFAVGSILEVDPIEISILEINDVLCFGESNGSLSVVVQGQITAIYKIYLDNEIYTVLSHDTTLIDSLLSASYVLEVLSPEGCLDSIIVNIEQPTELKLEVINFEPAIDTTGGILTLSGTGGTSRYQYSIDNGATFSVDSVFNLVALGAYDLAIQDANGCVTYQLYTVSGIKYQLNKNIEFNLFPNPVDDKMSIEFSSTTLNASAVGIYNSIGQLVLYKKIVPESSSSDLLLHCSGLSDGLYILKVTTSEGLATNTFVVSH